MASLKRANKAGTSWADVLRGLRADISRHKLNVSQRRKLEQEILRVAECEQRRIGQDLHDGLGQQLAGLWCATEALRKNLAAAASPEAATAARISNLLHSVMNQARGIARGLHPVPPGPGGLMIALRDLAASVTDLAHVSCEFVCLEPILVCSDIAATHLYRIAQEAVANALKHAHATKIKIELTLAGEKLALVVSNDGAPLPARLRRRHSLGWSIMNYRASMIGGRVWARNRAGSGAELACVVEQLTGNQGAIYVKTKADRTQRRQESIRR